MSNVTIAGTYLAIREFIPLTSIEFVANEHNGAIIDPFERSERNRKRSRCDRDMLNCRRKVPYSIFHISRRYYKHVARVAEQKANKLGKAHAEIFSPILARFGRYLKYFYPRKTRYATAT